MRHFAKLAFCTAFLLIPIGLSNAQSQTEEQLISYTKKINVSRLDPSLPRQTFDSWVTKILGPTTKLRWDANDCGEQSGTAFDKGRALPSCVGVEAELAAGRSITILVAIGTLNKGIAGKPVMFSSVLTLGDKFYYVNKLGELSMALKNKDIKWIDMAKPK
jgi:hypothetical protein